MSAIGIRTNFIFCSRCKSKRNSCRSRIFRFIKRSRDLTVDGAAAQEDLPVEGRKEMQLGVPLDTIERDEAPRGA
jgi:hypothetical protein